MLTTLLVIFFYFEVWIWQSFVSCFKFCSPRLVKNAPALESGADGWELQLTGAVDVELALKSPVHVELAFTRQLLTKDKDANIVVSCSHFAFLNYLLYLLKALEFISYD